MSILNIQEEQQLLAQAHAAWMETEKTINPPPEREQIDSLEVSWWKIYGWAFLIVITALGLFVAARTGIGIYEVNLSEGFIPWMALVLTVLGLVGIEGLIIVFGFFRPRSIGTSQSSQWLEKLLVLGLSGNRHHHLGCVGDEVLHADRYRDAAALGDRG